MVSSSKLRYTLAVGANSIDITNSRTGLEAVSISFMRTIRVPDNNTKNYLPPDLGKFPLHKIRDYAQHLPGNVAAKGGAFFPMHQKEATWINFTAREPFIVKVYAGGVNAISGEHSNEDIGTKFRRLKEHLSGRSVQDYLVLPAQRWLDGITVSPGVVRQFVAMPWGKGYGIEAQMTGEEVVGGLQLEITPLKRDSTEFITVETPTGDFLAFSNFANWTTLDLQLAIEKETGIHWPLQRLLLDGTQLQRSELLTTHGVKRGSVIALLTEQVGGGNCGSPRQMSIAAGGRIRQELRADDRGSQDWDKETTLAIPVQILSTDAFRRVTGRRAPACPVKAKHYAEAGCPFFHLAEQPGVSAGGGFGAVRSVGELERQRGRAPEKRVFPRVVVIDDDDDDDDGAVPAAQAEAAVANARRVARLARAVRGGDGLLSPDGPYRPFRTAERLRDELDAVDPWVLAQDSPKLMAEFLKLRG